MSYPDKDNVWHWLPEKIKWDQINPDWDDKSYFMNYGGEPGYFLINDVDFINGSAFGDSYDSLLISIKKLNMIVLVNYTAEMNELEMGDAYGNASNVYWYYGADPDNIFMNKQT